jgi:acetoin utilization protein AcuB
MPTAACLPNDEAQFSDEMGTSAGGGTGSPLLVGQVMTGRPTCVGPEATVLELVQIFHAKHFRHLLVVDAAGGLLGIVSDRDVGRCFGPTMYPDEATLSSLTARQIMSRDIVTVSSTEPLAAAIDRIYEEGVSSLPVIDDGRLVGIVTTTDLLRLLRRMLAG